MRAPDEVLTHQASVEPGVVLGEERRDDDVLMRSRHSKERSLPGLSNGQVALVSLRSVSQSRLLPRRASARAVSALYGVRASSVHRGRSRRATTVSTTVPGARPSRSAGAQWSVREPFGSANSSRCRCAASSRASSGPSKPDEFLGGPGGGLWRRVLKQGYKRLVELVDLRFTHASEWITGA